jgi:urea carboxylase
LKLDLRLRFKVHILYEQLLSDRLPGIVDLTPGIRSLQVHFHPRECSSAKVLDWVTSHLNSLPEDHNQTIPSRIVHLPLSWNDPATQLAVDKYVQSVRADAPWCPDNIEFIRRINGLGSIEEVKEIVFDANYTVLGLGDVYLGAPVATPLDPRHRLVTTKYNPARTWTPENAVGIGGAYMCIYGMEGPGGYQFVGRTLQMWNRYRTTEFFREGTPWLLRFFDQIKYSPMVVIRSR